MANCLKQKQTKQHMETQFTRTFDSEKDLKPNNLKKLKVNRQEVLFEKTLHLNTSPLGETTKTTTILSNQPTSRNPLRFQSDENTLLYPSEETRNLPENHREDSCIYQHFPNDGYRQYSRNGLNGKLQCTRPPRTVSQLYNGYISQEFSNPLNGPSTSESNCSTISKIRQNNSLKETSFSTTHASFEETQHQCFSGNSTVERSFVTNSEDEIESSVDKRLTKSDICCLDATEASSSFSQTSSTAHPWKNHFSNHKHHSNPIAWHMSEDNANCNHYVVHRTDSSSRVFENASTQEKYSPFTNAAQYCVGKKIRHHGYKKRKTSFNESQTKTKLTRGSVLRKTQRRKIRQASQSQARRNSALLAKNLAYRPTAILANHDVPDNFYSALFTMLLCFPPLGLASLIYSYKVREHLAAGNFEKAHRSSLLGRKLANTGIMLGMTVMAFGLIFFAIRSNIPYTGTEYDYSLQEWITR